MLRAPAGRPSRLSSGKGKDLGAMYNLVHKHLHAKELAAGHDVSRNEGQSGDLLRRHLYQAMREGLRALQATLPSKLKQWPS